MARDARINMRNGLVIPGSLLTLYGVIAIIYAEAFRAQSDFCADSNLILIAGVCYTVWKLILPLVLIGVALVISGAVAFRGEPDELEGHLHHGTPAHVGLAILISLVALPALGWLVQTIRQRGGDPFELTVLGARWEHTFLLELAMLVGLLMFIPYLSLYLANGAHRRAFVAAATAALDEEEEYEDEGPEYADTVAAEDANAADMTDDDDWPDNRDGDPAPRKSTAISCLAKVDGLSCREPVMDGNRYCDVHRCTATTRKGEPCRNEAIEEGMCQIHLAAT